MTLKYLLRGKLQLFVDDAARVYEAGDWLMLHPCINEKLVKTSEKQTYFNNLGNKLHGF